MAVRGTAATDRKTRWQLSHRYLTGQIARATNRTVAAYQLFSNLRIGIEINENVGEVNPVVNWLVLPETAKRPAMMLGTSSDRIGTPSGQSFYATVSKNLEGLIGLPLAPYAGISYGTYDDEIVFPCGLNATVMPNWSAMFMYDGVNPHLSTTYMWRNFALTLLLVDLRDFGFSVGVGF
jgi:hypothetical protein